MNTKFAKDDSEIDPSVINRLIRKFLDTFEQTAYGPGDSVAGDIRVFDATGNELHEAVDATLGGAPLAVTGGHFEVLLPEHLPENGVVLLDVSAGAIHKTVKLEPIAPAASAILNANVAGNQITVDVDVRDRFGNLAHQSAFDLAVIAPIVWFGSSLRLTRILLHECLQRGRFQCTLLTGIRVAFTFNLGHLAHPKMEII